MNPILTESRLLRYFSFTIFYIAQGLPFGLVSYALPAYLAEQDVSAGAIGTFIGVASLPWTFKLFAGPIMDRFTYLAMGRRRPWVILTQVCLVLTGIAFSFFPDAIDDVAILTALCFTLNLFAASQDVAVDGMAIDVLPVEEHGRANAFMALGQVTGISGSTVIAAFTVLNFGMTGIALMLAIGFGLILFWSIVVRERTGEKVLPWSSGQATERSLNLKAEGWREIGVELSRVLLLPASLLMLCVAFLFRFADGLWITIAPLVVVQELGMQSTEYSTFTSIASFIAAVAGLSVGLFIDRMGVRLLYMLALFAYGVLALGVGLVEFIWSSPVFLLCILFLQSFIYQGVFISFIATSMNLCWVKVAATQFAIYMAFANLGRSFGASFIAAVEEHLAYNQMFFVVSIAFFIATTLVWRANMKAHRQKVQALDIDLTPKPVLS